MSPGGDWNFPFLILTSYRLREKGGRSLPFLIRSVGVLVRRASLRRLGKGPVNQPLNLLLVHSVDDGDFRHDQVLRAFVHLLLAERKGLPRTDVTQGFQDIRDIRELA